MEPKEKAKEVLQDILDKLSEEAEIEVKEEEEEEETATFTVKGPDLGLVIGRQGQTLDAIQCILNAIVNKEAAFRKQVIVDAEGYRQRQRKTVEELAIRTAEKAIEGEEPITLRPMSSFERKMVHLALKDDPRIETVSEGKEPYRRVIIYPKEERIEE